MYLRDSDVGKRYAVTAKTVWQWSRNGQFPAPVKLTPGCTRWKLTDIEAWEAEREKRKGVT